MKGAFTRYRELYVSLMMERATRTLAIDDEARFAEELDRCWNEMSDDEQREIERSLTQATISKAPARLDVVDADPRRGCSDSPRRSA